MPSYKALLVDDEDRTAETLSQFLHSRGIGYDRCKGSQDARHALKTKPYSIVFLDLDLGSGSHEGIGFLSWINDEKLHLPTVIVSRAAHTSQVIRAEQAYSFVKLSLTPDQLKGLADVLDSVMSTIRNPPVPPIAVRLLGAVAGLTFAALSGLIALKIYTTFHDVEREARIVLFLVLFTTMCGLVQVFGTKVVHEAIGALGKVSNTKLAKIFLKN